MNIITFPLFILSCFLSFKEVKSYSTGVNACTSEPGHGTSSSSPDVYILQLLDQGASIVSSWIAGEQYTLKLTSTTLANFRGFKIGPFAASSYTSFSDLRVGHFLQGQTHKLIPDVEM
jgi:hypothetical protein